MRNVPKDISKFYLKSSIEYIIYGFFTALRQDQSLSLDAIAQKFQQTYSFEEDDLPVASIKTVYRKLDGLKYKDKVNLKELWGAA